PHAAERPTPERLSGFELNLRPRQHVAVDARGEGRHQCRLVGVDSVKLGKAKRGGCRDIAQRHRREALFRDQAEEGIERGLVRRFHPASSLERRAAAAYALSKTRWMPSSPIRTFSASAVRPPGPVRLTR